MDAIGKARHCYTFGSVYTVMLLYLERHYPTSTTKISSLYLFFVVLLLLQADIQTRVMIQNK